MRRTPMRIFRLLVPGAVCIGLLAGCSGAAPDPSSATQPSGSAANASADPIPLGIAEQELEPGVHRLDLTAIDGGDPYPQFEVSIPAGWSSMDGWALFRPSDGQDAPSVAVTFWDVDEVYGDPCGWEGTQFQPGEGVEDLANALVGSVDRRGRSVAPARAAELDGYGGAYLELRVPESLTVDEEGNFLDCDDDGAGHHDYRSWTGEGWASTRYHQGPGQLDRLWILDVEGQRLVIDAFSMPWASDAEVAELVAVVESIRFLDE